MHKLLGVRLVASGMALILLFQNFMGLGAGPYVTGLVIDAVGKHLYAAAGHGDFKAMCPGGAAPAGSAPDALAACHTALTAATRAGLWSMVLILAWALLHYALASRHLRRRDLGAGLS